MPLQIRRGTEAERQILAAPLVAGELLWITDDKKLYIGDGVTVANLLTPVTGFDANDAISAVAGAFAAGTQSGISFSYNGVDAISATVSYPSLLQNLNVNNFNIVDASATVLINGATGAINLDGTVKGNVIPNANEAYDLGSASNRFRDLYLSGSSLFLGTAQITASGSAVNLPAGSTVDGISIASIASGVVEGSNYKINIVGEDSSILVNAQTGVISSTSGFIGDLTGSVFGDNSSVIVDAIDNSLFCNDITILGDITLSGDIISPNTTIDIVNTDPTINTKIRRYIPEGGNHTDVFATTQGTYASGSNLYLSRGTLTTPTTVVVGDTLNSDISFAHDGNDFTITAAVVTAVDPYGTVSAGAVPGIIGLYTLNDGNVANLKGLVVDSIGWTSINKTTSQAQATLDVNGFAKLAVLTAAPSSLADGMIAIADGTSWDPSGGATPGKQQAVVYLAGGWRAMAVEP